MAVQALGYLGISTQDIDEWSDFATRQLGSQLVDRGVSRRAFRVDDRRQRFVVDLAGKLEAAGVAVQREPATLVDQRFVPDLISFRDPAGNRLEVFHGPLLSDTPLRLAAMSLAFALAPSAWAMSCFGHGS